MPLNLQRDRIDVDRSTKGRWVSLSEGGDFLIARWENPEFRRLQTELYQKYRRADSGRRHIKRQTVPPAIAEMITLELVVKTVILDWKNINEEEGKPFPYSVKNCDWLLIDRETKDPEYPSEFRCREDFRWIYDEIVRESQDDLAYRLERHEEDSENLSPSSDGNSPTENT